METEDNTETFKMNPDTRPFTKISNFKNYISCSTYIFNILYIINKCIILF